MTDGRDGKSGRGSARPFPRPLPQRSLARVLGLGDLSILSSASMAPAYSIASTFGLMLAKAGDGAVLALIVLTLAVACIALAFHRLCEQSPSAGATYAWSRLAFGERAGAFAAWIVIFSYFVSAVAAVVPAGIYTLDLVAPRYADSAWAVALAGSAWVLVASALLVGGVRPTARMSGLFLCIEFAVLLAFAGIAFAHAPVAHSQTTRLLTLGSGGLAGFLSAMVLAIWVTDGWEVSSYTSEENSGPPRQPGMGGLIALLVTAALVLCCMFAFARVGPLRGFVEHAGDSLAYVGQQLGGGWRSVLLVVTVLVSTAATLWTTQLGLSRGIFSMARDRLFSERLAAVHPKFGTPHVSIILVNAGVLAVTLLTALEPTAKEALSAIINASSIMLGLTFVLTGAACVWHFARSGAEPSDLTRIVLPSIGTLAVAGLLVVNFVSQDVVDRLVALGCVAFSLAYAWWPGRTQRAASQTQPT